MTAHACILYFFVCETAKVILNGNLNDPHQISNLFYVKLKDVFFVRSWLITVIYIDETMQRSLQRNLTINLFIVDLFYRAMEVLKVGSILAIQIWD